MHKETFNALDKNEQWIWLVENKGLVTQIELDNDETYISFIDQSGECRFKSDIGSRGGAFCLLIALGFTVNYV